MMKILEIDYEYYYFPQELSCLEAFVEYANSHYNSFIKLTHLETENCVFPYFICEETKDIFANIATMQKISEAEATVLCRSDYEDRLKQVVKEKCTHCVYYEEHTEGDNLIGHREKLSLDGQCWRYQKKD